MSAIISAGLEEIFRDELQVRTKGLTRKSHLIDEVGLDSVAFAVGLVSIEERFGVRIDEEDLLGCDTAGDLDDLITSKLEQARQ